jgi:hypothetical protein
MSGGLRKCLRGSRRTILSTLLPSQPGRNRQTLPQQPKGGLAKIAATIINGMRPEKIGRAFGIGLRVAGRIAGQRLAGAAQPAQAQQVAGTAASTPPGLRTAGEASTRPRRSNVARGIGGFLRPFQRVGGILWLEVTGVFFLLPVVVFAPTVWRTRLSWSHGPDHRTFVASAIVVVVFLYLGVTSFLRARRK